MFGDDKVKQTNTIKNQIIFWGDETKILKE